MAIDFKCPDCMRVLRMDSDLAGRVVRCGACRATVRVPIPEPEPEEVPLAREVAEDESDAPVRAEPVAPQDEPDDYDRPRRRRRRRPPEPAGRGAGFWITIILGSCLLLFGVGVGGCAWVTRPHWRSHESAAGGFKVDLPAAPRSDLRKLVAAADPKNPIDAEVQFEGTLLMGRFEGYCVVYVDIDPLKQQWKDEEILDEAEKNMETGTPPAKILKSRKLSVNGFSAREVVFIDDGETCVARIVVAETRLYIVTAGGRFVSPEDERIRRFINSFEITDPKLLAEAARRREAQRR